jgi:hypothetical protein
MIYGLTLLPPRMLNETDVIGNITDFTDNQNRYLKRLKISLYFENYPIWTLKWISRIIAVSLHISYISFSSWFPYSIITALISGILIKIINLID